MNRVLHIVTTMNRGGLETMIMNYYRHIDRNLLQFDFLVHRDEIGAYEDEISELGGKIFRLNKLNPFSKKYLTSLDFFFKSHKEYRIVHCHLDCLSAIPLAAAKKNGVPVRIAHTHSSRQDKNLKYAIKLYYKKKIKKYATDLFACGETAGKWTFETDAFKIIPNAISTEEYVYSDIKRCEMREVLDIGESVFVIGHVGRFDIVKNHKFLLDVFDDVRKESPDAVLMLVGGGTLMEQIKNKAKSMGIEQSIKFLGIRNDVADLLQAMDVFCMPSLYEGLPVTLIEAQAAGLPCIISDRIPKDCKITDLVQQLSLEDAPKKWAEKIISVCGRKRDDPSEKIKAAHYDICENAKWLQDFYKKALGG